MMCRVMDGKFAEGKDRAVVSNAVSPVLLMLKVAGRKRRWVAGAVGEPGRPVRRPSP